MDKKNNNTNLGMTPEWFEKMASMSPRMEVHSKDGTKASSELHKVEIIKDGVKTVVFEDKVSLSTNETESDSKPNSSSVKLSVPIETQDNIVAQTSGNASITFGYPRPKISLLNDQKEIKVSSISGEMYAVVRIDTQRNEGFNYFDLIFGKTRVKETTCKNGKKDRPHITFFPDANLKYSRLSEYQCELSGELEYDREKRILSNAKSVIHCLEFDEELTLSFDLDTQNNTLILISVEFTTST